MHPDHVGYRSDRDDCYLHSNKLYGDGQENTYFWACTACCNRDHESIKNPLNRKLTRL